MKRYNQVRDGSYEPRSEMVEERDGDWVWYEDVEELQSKCAEMLEALKLLLAECDHQVSIGNMPYDWVSFGIARAAIAKAEGDSNEDR